MKEAQLIRIENDLKEILAEQMFIVQKVGNILNQIRLERGNTSGRTKDRTKCSK